MHFVVGSYAVGIWSRTYGGNKSRYIDIKSEAYGSGASGVQRAILFFTPDDSPYNIVTDSYVAFDVPWAEFRDIYHILQTEAPCHFLWDVDSQNNVKLCHVGTSDEPPGEGLRDLSP